VSPQHRGLRISERFPSLIETLGRSMHGNGLQPSHAQASLHGRKIRTPGLATDRYHSRIRHRDGGAWFSEARV
jgi:hypothetical protein